jgi:hypothetical protein
VSDGLVYSKDTHPDLPVAGYSVHFEEPDLTGDQRYFDMMWIKGQQDYKAFDDVIAYCRERALVHRKARLR